MADASLPHELKGLRQPPPWKPPTAVAQGGHDDGGPLDGRELYVLAMRFMETNCDLQEEEREACLMDSFLRVAAARDIVHMEPFRELLGRHENRLRTQIKGEKLIGDHDREPTEKSTDDTVFRNLVAMTQIRFIGSLLVQIESDVL